MIQEDLELLKIQKQKQDMTKQDMLQSYYQKKQNEKRMKELEE